jgi:hypothetical protein
MLLLAIRTYSSIRGATVSVQRRALGETVVAPRTQFARKRTPPAEQLPGCWTDRRLANVPVMIATMLDACNDATILSQIYEVVDSDRRRREAAAA